MTVAPPAIVMLIKDLAYVTVRDYKDKDGQSPTGADGGPPTRGDDTPARAIEPLDDKFGMSEIVDQWLSAVDQQIDAETGGLPLFDLDDIDGLADFIASHLKLNAERNGRCDD